MDESVEQEIEGRAYALAIEASAAAGRRVLKFWNNPANPDFDPSAANEITGKSGVGNFATLADLEAESILLSRITADPELGRFGIVTEESGTRSGTSNWRWVLDPIDGTLPFRNGAPEFGVAVGLLRGDRPVVGVIAMPALGRLIAARRGSGARLLSFDGEVLLDLRVPVRPSDIPLEEALVGFDIGYTMRAEQLRDVATHLAPHVGYLVSYCSPVTAGFRLALGQLSGYVFQQPTIYDIAATAAIIHEIGGVMTDFDGKPIDWHAATRSVVAARTPGIHALLHDMIAGERTT